MPHAHPPNPKRISAMFTDESRQITLELRRAEAELSHAREELVRSIHAVESEATRVLDWRAWIQRNPLLFLGSAFALGFFLGRRD